MVDIYVKNIIKSSETREETSIHNSLLFLIDYSKNFSKKQHSKNEKHETTKLRNTLASTINKSNRFDFFAALQRLISSSNRDLASSAVTLLGNLAFVNPKFQGSIRECRAIDTLVDILCSRDHPTSQIDPGHIVVALKNISNGWDKNQRVCILDSGYITALVNLMQKDQAHVITAITNTCKSNPRSQKAFAEAGAITNLSKLLSEAQDDIMAHALVQALGKI